MPKPINSTGKALHRPAASKPAPPQRGKVDLSPGDTIEFSMTAGIKHSGVDYWIKYGATTAVRPDESGTDADDRLNEVVVQGLNSKITDITS